MLVVMIQTPLVMMIVMMFVVRPACVDPATVLVQWLAVLVRVPGLGSIGVPLEPARVVKVRGSGLPGHVMRHWLAQNLLHHCDVFFIVMSLKQGVSL